MRLERRRIAIGEDEAVSAVVAFPARFEPGAAVAVILAHGAGNDMTNPLLSAVHEGLAERGFLAVKFNFPYTERSRRAPDRAPILEACYRRVVEAIRDDAALRPRAVVLGGKSLGGRMASHLAAQGVSCAALLFLGYPLHPPGRRDKLRVDHLAKIKVPMLFFAGTRDALSDLELLKHAISELSAPVTLHVIEGGDHSFKVPKRAGRSAEEVTKEIVDASARWLERIINGRP